MHPSPRARVLSLAALGAALAFAPAACTSAPSGAAPVGLSCDARPDPHCSNPIDRVLVPLARERSLPIREASSAELCRRLAIDLLDRIPTVDEQHACEALPMAERVDAFMATDDYVRHERRLWASRIGYDVFVAWWRHVVELDELALRLARGDLSYPAFVRALLVHPGFLALHRGDDWPKGVVRVAFDRDARADEIAGLRPLTRPFTDTVFCDGAALWTRTALYGADPEAVDSEYCGVELPVFDSCYCAAHGCATSALGRPVDFDVAPCAVPAEPYDRANLLRFSNATPDGARTTCPDGTVAPACADRELDEESGMAGAPFPPLAGLDDAARERLGDLGRALEERDETWDAAADRELSRLLGWWKSGFRQPEWDLPAVRRVVADELRRTKSLRHIQKLILESLLYVAPSAPPASPDGSEPPPWSMGPLKLLAGEAWLDSVGVVVGETVGRCDFRFLTTEEDESIANVDPNVVDAPVTTLGPAFMGNDLSALGDGLRTSEVYRRLAKQLGGCNNTTGRAVASSVGIVAAQRDLAQRLCAAGRGVLPAGLDPADTSPHAIESIVAHVGRRALGPSPGAGQREALAAEVAACVAAGPSAGCADAASAARWLCQHVVDSADFAIY